MADDQKDNEMDIAPDGWFDIARWVECEALRRPGYVFELQNAEGMSLFTDECLDLATVEYPYDWKSRPQRFRLIVPSVPTHSTPMPPPQNR